MKLKKGDLVRWIDATTSPGTLGIVLSDEVSKNDKQRIYWADDGRAYKTYVNESCLELVARHKERKNTNDI